MKQITLLILCMLTLSHAQAQLTVDDFYQPGATWCDVDRHGVGFGSFIQENYYWQIADDTVINSTTYRKLKLEYSNYRITLGGLRVQNDTVLFVRTDTMANSGFSAFPCRAYINNLPMGTEMILYKFDLMAGDSLDFKAYYKTVQSVTQVQLANGQMVNKYNFAGGDYWIYGIGAKRGLIASLTQGQPVYGLGYNSQNVYYQHDYAAELPYYAGCFPTSVGETQKQKNLLDIYPNPVTGDNFQINIQTPIERIIITDMAGRIVKDASDMQAGKHTIQLTGISAGIYLLQAQYKDGSVVQEKLVRQ